MTRKPPPEIVPRGVLEGDLEFGAFIAAAKRRRIAGNMDATEAWHQAYIEHRRQVRLERARYEAVCAELRELYGAPAGTPRGATFPETAWHQADFDSIGGTDDEAVFSSPDGEWFAADAAQYFPPCERES